MYKILLHIPTLRRNYLDSFDSGNLYLKSDDISHISLYRLILERTK